MHGIKETGFQKEFAGSHKGTMFGRGIYFAECSSKSDEYATADATGKYAGCCAMILCRVVLGNPATLLTSDLDLVEPTPAPYSRRARLRAGENAWKIPFGSKRARTSRCDFGTW